MRIEFEVPRNAVGLVRVKVEDSHITLSRLADNLWQQIENLELWQQGQHSSVAGPRQVLPVADLMLIPDLIQVK